MAINSTMHPFTETNINLCGPDRAGVYGLYDSSSMVIFYGSCLYSIKIRLRAHFSGAEGSDTKRAIYFNYEIVPDPKQREKELLEEYKRIYGRLPRCNFVH